MIRLLLSLVMTVTAPLAVTASAETVEYRDLVVEVRGEGQPVVMIPGLNSAASTWSETCDGIQPAECHMLHLPGFAGRPPVETEPFLESMRDQVIGYARDRQLQQPVIVGHSLGGVLSMMVAIEAPDVPDRLVLVDALPFLPAIRSPGATAQSMQPIAESMQTEMLDAPEEQYQARARGNVSRMSLSPDRIRQLEEWGDASARSATAQAMYELMTTDLRQEVADIRQPTLVLGSWAAYAPSGATKESTAGIFRAQYEKLDDHDLRMSDDGYHFLMWDDPELVVAAIREQLAQ